MIVQLMHKMHPVFFGCSYDNGGVCFVASLLSHDHCERLVQIRGV